MNIYLYLKSEKTMEEKFRPTLVATYRSLLNFQCGYTLKSNIIYNLQYLEFVFNNIKNHSLELTTNLISMNIKSYMICFISIVESIFYIELKNRKLLPIENYEKETQQDMFIENEAKKISTIVSKKVKSFIPNLSMDQLTKKIEKNHIYPLLAHNNFAKLKALRNLRNKVHLHLAETPDQSDYNSFNRDDINTANEVLLNILDHYSTNDSLLSQLPFNEKI